MKKAREAHEFIDDFIDPNYICEDCQSRPPLCQECRELKTWKKNRLKKEKRQSKYIDFK
jgi:hypothetical protein